MADTYTIKSIDQTTGNIVVNFSFDGKDQKLNAPINDAQALTDFLNAYATAYRQGKEQEASQTTAPQEVTAMIGQAQEVIEPVATE